MRPSILIFPGFPGKVLCFEIPMAVLTPWEVMILLEKWTQTNSSQQAANCYSQIESTGKGLSRLWSNLMGKLYNYLLLELRETKIWTQLFIFTRIIVLQTYPCLEYIPILGVRLNLRFINIPWRKETYFEYKTIIFDTSFYLQCFSVRENKYNIVLSTHLHKTQG